MTKEVKWGRFKEARLCDTWWHIVTVIASSFAASLVRKRQKCLEPGAEKEKIFPLNRHHIVTGKGCYSISLLTV